MLSSIKRLLQKGKDSTVSSSDLLQQPSTDQAVQVEENELSDVFPKISFHPLMHIEDERRYVYQFLNNELAPLKPNQLSLSAIELEANEDGSATVTAFVRNSLEKAVHLEDAILLLISEEGEILGKKGFKLEELGDMPPCSSRPWHFVFEREFLLKEDLPEKGFELAFDLSKTIHRLDIDPTWEGRLTEEQITELSNLVNTLPKLRVNEVSLHALRANYNDDGNLAVNILVRNGSTTAVNLELLPLEMLNEKGEIIAKGLFTLPPLTIQANTSKPWTFIFPQELVEIQAFSQWSIRVPDQEVI
ncbi:MULTISPECIES: accessory Sec system S-layer assembly protein [unclassified Bacillus (in: firmicutes)]|uniref:accessory Sec system S-layer assembly protein n=1 Tax=unclassified Bacillus (in: firmicutes) TaxID=185979 RepID=UPI000BF073F4|nr:MULTISPECIES: accessory Sec system S-layer assembly protein [unclassified Bacillus (in: firmicutes)]PEJ58426.1 accessory Sec system S-layer assembly protein [Bacillus sp. AFS002410]PEL07001.1 accessory Sec system S-layer assembly protein [Bacillus sp. AFS017336]